MYFLGSSNIRRPLFLKRHFEVLRGSAVCLIEKNRRADELVFVVLFKTPLPICSSIPVTVTYRHPTLSYDLLKSILFLVCLETPCFYIEIRIFKVSNVPLKSPTVSFGRLIKKFSIKFWRKRWSPKLRPTGPLKLKLTGIAMN